MTREIEVSRKVCSQIINVSSVAFLYISGSNIQQRILLSSDDSLFACHFISQPASDDVAAIKKCVHHV